MVKKAHFVPISYLKGFTYDKDHKMVYAYNNKAGIFNSSVRDVCTRKYIYRLEVAEDGDLDFIEDTLAKEIEPKYSGWVSAIRDKKPLDNSTIADLSIFITLQHLRVPGSLQFLRDNHVLALKDHAKDKMKDLYNESARNELWKAFQIERPEYYRQAIEKHPEWEGGLPEEVIRKMIDEDGIELEVDPGKNNVLVSMIDLILPTADQFIRRTWSFLFAPEGTEFITSDMPAFVAIPNPNGVIHFKQGGFGRADAAIFFPIAKDICAVIGGVEYGQNFYSATKDKVDEVNRIVATRPSLTYIISSSEELIKKYSKFQTNKPVSLEGIFNCE
jgi:hypothetical protein